MTSMGYPSTWKDVLDENGEKVPKRNKSGETVLNADGSIRYRQEPDKQGIIDWIEEQKQWLQQEMLRRYGWRREYKGSHPRGNLSTPDYQVARAKERKDEILKQTREELINYTKHIHDITDTLQADVRSLYNDKSSLELINRYLQLCPDEQYKQICKEAATFLATLPRAEEKIFMESLKQKIASADDKAVKTPTTKSTTPEYAQKQR